MNIVREQREQNNSLIKVTVGEKDYGDAVEKSLREYKRKANIPGFRPGRLRKQRSTICRSRRSIMSVT